MKRIMLFCMSLLSMSSCVVDKELDQVMSETPSRSITIHHLSQTDLNHIPTKAFAYVHFRLLNLMPDYTLKVKSIQLCNIHQGGTFYFPTEYKEGYWTLQSDRTSITVNDNSIEIAPMDSLLLTSGKGILCIPQTVKAWSPSIHPNESKDCHLLVNCQIYQKESDYYLWENPEDSLAEIAIPLTIHLQAGHTRTFDITLQDNAPWYHIGDSIPTRLLTPITFGPSVEDWVEISN